MGAGGFTISLHQSNSVFNKDLSLLFVKLKRLQRRIGFIVQNAECIPKLKIMLDKRIPKGLKSGQSF